MSYVPEKSFDKDLNAFEAADHQYSSQDYEGETQVEQGTAETHEQLSDAYMTGNNTDDS
jgi:hypothetical protein